MSVHVGKQTIDNSSENRLQNVSQSVGNAEQRNSICVHTTQEVRVFGFGQVEYKMFA